jgi:hypothetical protein
MNRYPMSDDALRAAPLDDLIDWASQISEERAELPRCLDGGVHPDYLIQSSALQNIAAWIEAEIIRRPDVLRPAFGG